MKPHDTHEILTVTADGTDTVATTTFDLRICVARQIIVDDLSFVTDAFADILDLPTSGHMNILTTQFLYISFDGGKATT